MICTKRDREILAKLSRYGILSTSQIKRIFFPDVDLTTVRRRLRILEAARFIFRIPGLDDGGLGWALTQKSAAELGSSFPIRHFNRNSIEHDVLLSEVRLSLEGIGLGAGWIPEHVLKRKTPKASYLEERFVPDALLTVTNHNKNRVVALELELNAKNKKRYEKILQKYLRMKNLWALWYLVPSESVGKMLESVWSKLNSSKRNDLFIWSLIDEVLTNPTEALVRSEHLRLPLKNLIVIPALRAAPTQSRESNEISKTQTA